MDVEGTLANLADVAANCLVQWERSCLDNAALTSAVAAEMTRLEWFWLIEADFALTDRACILWLDAIIKEEDLGEG